MTFAIHFTGPADNPILQLKRHTMTQYAVAPDKLSDKTEYLTPGKRYIIHENHSNGVNTIFQITDDAGNTLICLKTGCAHLKDDWTFTENPS